MKSFNRKRKFSEKENFQKNFLTKSNAEHWKPIFSFLALYSLESLPLSLEAIFSFQKTLNLSKNLLS